MTSAPLKDLASLSKSLNEASDTLSKEISRVETALNSLKLGVSAWVIVNKYRTDSELTVGGKPETVTKVESLGYGKHRGKWCLLFGESLEEYPDPEMEIVTPLREAPRMERIEAVDKLPELVVALQTKATKVAEMATEKAQQVSELASALKTVMP